MCLLLILLVRIQANKVFENPSGKSCVDRIHGDRGRLVLRVSQGEADVCWKQFPVEMRKLQSQDPEAPPKWMNAHQKSTWLAYNRRVDIILEPAGQQSAEAFPNDAPGARILWERPQPNLKAVETVAAQISSGSGQALAASNVSAR
jgi:hypothetical protein